LKKYSAVKAFLDDPDLGVSKGDIDKIQAEKETLPEVEKQIQGDKNSRKANSFG
jgi:hypothetical protein